MHAHDRRKFVAGSGEALLEVVSVAVSDVCNAVAVITNPINLMRDFPFVFETRFLSGNILLPSLISHRFLIAGLTIVPQSGLAPDDSLIIIVKHHRKIRVVSPQPLV